MLLLDLQCRSPITLGVKNTASKNGHNNNSGGIAIRRMKGN